MNISNTATASTYPAVVADKAGNVHVLWSEDFGGPTSKWVVDKSGAPVLDVRGHQLNLLTNDGNTLYYTRWDGSKWLEPVDVRIAPEGILQYPQAAVDTNGVLHVIWVGGSNPHRLYYTRAQANKAESTQAWSPALVLADTVLLAGYPDALVADAKGGLHVLYSQLGDQPGAYVINSTDGGQSWSDPIQIFGTSDSAGARDGVSSMRLIADAKGRLHATWTRFGEDGNGKGIYYSQSRDSGQMWSNAIEVAVVQPGWYEVDWLSTGVVGDEIHLVWEGGVVSALNERISRDGGLTWDGARQILPNLVGENGFANLVVDSAGQLHMLVVKRADAGTLAHGVWYTTWTGGGWQDPILLGTRDGSLYATAGQLDKAALLDRLGGTFTGNGLRYQQAAVLDGNVLFVAVVNEWDGDIYSTHTTLSAPAVAASAYPSPTATATAEPTVTDAPVERTRATVALPASSRLTDTPPTRSDDASRAVPLGAAGAALFVLAITVRALATRRA